MTKPRKLIESDNLSLAWQQAFMAAWAPSEVHPLCVTVTGFADGVPHETEEVRGALDDRLEQLNKKMCATVASTIFPSSYWNPELPAECLYDRYLRVFPRLKKHDRRNSYGTYFQRMIAFGETPINQLDHVLNTWKRGNRRRSAYQIAIVNPACDLTHQRRRGFPCLQHIVFTPNERARTLAITGVYGTQEIFERAYGNYLGLCHLGQFMAFQMGLQLSRMTCFAAVAMLRGGQTTKRDLEPLYNAMVTANPGLCEHTEESAQCRSTSSKDQTK